MGTNVPIGKAVRAALMLSAIVGIWVYLGSGSHDSQPAVAQLPTPATNDAPQVSVRTPEQRVVDEMIDRFRLAANEGTDTDICVQAGMVKAAMMQAHDSVGYANWSKLEHHDCVYTSENTLRDRAHSAAENGECGDYLYSQSLNAFPGCLQRKKEKIKVEEERLYQSILADETYLLPKGKTR